ncbi:MAG: T9SS type A sorting domain-containing protein, partial [Bacteroidia bacterium]|nr:T9SS type A sorting domain-containing protein [Bacteroidia bacterium]
YMSTQNGDWDNKNSWLNGNVQPIPGTTSVVNANISIDWNIVQTSHDIVIADDSDLPSSNDGNRSVLALLVDSNEIHVDGNTALGTGFGLTVTHYLKLDGDIDLEGESQLIQTDGGDLDVTSAGRIERDQQGTADVHTYNYWSSPVGVSNITTNNNSFTLPDVMRDGTQNINWLTSGYDGANTNPVSIADYWIWKFANLLDDDYSAWQHVRSTGTLLAGEGFTMKGPGSGAISDDQNYVFTGKPNNGDINLTLNAGNDYLIGNPYPSAIDAHQFILDNAPIIEGTGATTGTLYFWEHWGGGSHNLQDYLGGYATYNLAGGIPAATLGTNDPDVGTGGIPTKIPGRFIPVSQGFFVIGEANGTINFNNGQRVFRREAVGSSIFMEANNADTGMIPGRAATEEGEAIDDPRMKLRIGLNSINEIHRQLLVTVDENATPGFDWGYDGLYYESQIDDMYWMIGEEKYTIQGTNTIDAMTVLQLGIHTDSHGLNSIMIDKLENVMDDVQIFLHDKELEIYHDLRVSEYQVYLNAGSYLDRFEITFSNQDVLDIEDTDLDVFDVHYDNAKESIVLMNPSNRDMDAIELFNILGQSVFTTTAVDNSNYSEFKVSNLSTGTYIIKVNTAQGAFSKKVLVK